jgi:branched-chain amino acid transport system substrate-binding protein
MLVSRRRFAAGLAGGTILAASGRAVRAAPVTSIRLGMLHSITGPISVLAREQTMGMQLALDMLGNKLGGVPVEVFEEDAGMTPETGLQSVTKLIEQNHVDIVLGNQLSNQLLAFMPVLAKADVVTFSDLPGPSELAGKQCSGDLFVMSWENTTNSAAIGQAMTNAGVKKAFFIAQNYVTGKEYVAGAKTFYKGDVVGETYVPIAQTDYAAEIAAIQAARPDGVYVFLPGAGGIAFVKQFAASGLRNKIKLYSGSWLADEHSFVALGDTALGARVTANWFADLPNAENKTFVEAFGKKNGRHPVIYAAMVYDNVMLLDLAVKAVGGNVVDRAGLRAAIRQAVSSGTFKSVRGPFAFNTNQFPIQDFYMAEVVKQDGVLMHKTLGTVFTNFKDSYAKDCKPAG